MQDNKRTYTVYRSARVNHKTIETVIDVGLCLEAARSKEQVLNTAERLKHPEKTAWTRDLYHIRLEVEPGRA